MNRKHISVIVLSGAAAIALYALLGFLLLPYGIKNQMVAHVEQKLGHRLALGAVRFNPFTLRLEFSDIDLREPDGGPMFACRRFALDFELAGLWRRSWTFAAIQAEAPHVHAELRPGGAHNFSALLAALRHPKPQPKEAMPKLAIDRIVIAEGRVDLADRRAGESARLTLAPIAFELTELTTEASDTSPYKLTARSADGERIQWHGEVSLNPAASNGHLQLQGWNAQTVVRWLGNRIALQRATGTLDLAFDYRASYAQGSTAFTLSNLDARIGGLALVGRDASEPFAAVEKLHLSGGALDLATRKFSVERLEIARAALRLEAGADGRTNWMAIIAAAQPAASAPAPAPLADALAAPPPAEPAAVAPAHVPAAPWSGRLGQLVLADSSFAYADRDRADRTLALTGIRLELTAELTHADAATELTATNPQTTIARLDARTEAQQLSAADAAWNASAITVRMAGPALDVAVRTTTLGLAGITLRQGSDDLQVGKLAVAAESVRTVSTAEAAARTEASALAVDANAIAGRTGKDGKNTVEAATASARVQHVAIEPGASNVRIEGMSGTLKDLLLRDPGSGNELVRVALAEMAGGSAALGERRLSIETVALAEAHATGVLSADGKSNWDAFLAAFGADRAAPANARPKLDSLPWNAVVRAVELRNSGASFTDQRQNPPFTMELQQVNARTRNASTERKTPLRLELSGRIKDGGQFNAAGRIDPHTLASDLKVKVSSVSLLPLQPFVARHARVQIVNALVSADGRLRYNMAKAAGADLVFEGDFGLDKVIVEETEPAQSLLSVETLRASQAKLTLEPDRLEIPDLRLNTLATRLQIAEDQSVNFAKLLRMAQKAEPSAARPSPEAAGGKPAAAANDSFPIVISRVRLDNSVLEFSDLSLRPQFNTRMHELQGVITGISTSASTRARMELEARVDEFGSAQIRGVMNLFKPHVFTDVTMIFRNLEMTDLTPYAAKFAGYRIASGKLSLDLDYRVKNSALVGQNKIVVDKLELGERVESPSALDLPLELAIAILKDENGRIDIGLPVSGNLEDPQFSIAGLVWKAIGSLLGRIVSAPFRALGRLFGTGADSENLDSIEFDAGVARIAPPERQKLQTVAEALAKRPDLKLTVKPAYAPQGDRNALQSMAMRRAVLARAGIKLEPGEAPGPLDYGNARIRRAIEDQFTDAFGFPAARDLRAELAKSARKPAGETPPPAPAQEPPGDGSKPQANPPAAGETRTARAMARRLMEAHAVNETELTALAQRRGEAITGALLGSAKVDAARVATAAPRALEGDAERSVATQLELGVAK